jgi:hypothetical protein
VKHFLILSIILLANMSFTQNSDWYAPYLKEAKELYKYSNEDYFIIAKLSTQELYLIRNGEVLKCYSISGSKYGAVITR